MAQTITMSRRVAEQIEITAPPSRVFEALTVPVQLLAWWGDRRTFPSTHWEVELRVGGKWLSHWRTPDGQTFALGGEIIALEAAGCRVTRGGDRGFHFEDPFGFTIDVVER